jgi:RNA polymerase sigma-70 factor (ECF subfamily)
MPGREEPVAQRQVVYCLVPRDLAPALHDRLRRHFRENAGVEVVVEARAGDRRLVDRRSRSTDWAGVERRRIAAAAGRRAGERRALTVAVQAPQLPRSALRHADRLSFVERLEPSRYEAEDLDTARLVTRAQSGESDVFALLYLRYFDRVYGYLRIAFNDAHQAEDGAQHVFTEVLRALPRYSLQRGPFRAWLFVIVRNYTITQLQKQSRVTLMEPEELDRQRDQPADGEELSALNWVSDSDLLLFIERLPVAQRQVLVLRYMLDLTAAQTAAILDRSPEDVRNLQSRAHRFLRERLVAIGRTAARPRARSVRCPKKAPVLRHRRFALIS